jgi:hypothetical protein
MDTQRIYKYKSPKRVLKNSSRVSDNLRCPELLLLILIVFPLQVIPLCAEWWVMDIAR